MSRTLKDRSWRLRFPTDAGAERRKAPRHIDIEWRYLRQTPGWFVTLYVESQRRAELRNWRHAIAFCSTTDLMDFDNPPHPKAKREYYW